MCDLASTVGQLLGQRILARWTRLCLDNPVFRIEQGDRSGTLVNIKTDMDGPIFDSRDKA